MEKSDVKQSAVQFLKLIVDGRIDDAYQKYADMDGKHHNIFTPAGFRALKNAMKENDIRFPGKRLVIKDVLVDGDLVAVHSNLILYKRKSNGLIAVHLLGFKNGKMVEFWDCAQEISMNLLNKDGAF